MSEDFGGENKHHRIPTGAEHVSDYHIVTEKRDTSTPGVVYIGRSYYFPDDAGEPDENDPIWQIERRVFEAGVETRIFAADGAFNQVWADRASIGDFPSLPSGIGEETLQFEDKEAGSSNVSYPSTPGSNITLFYFSNKETDRALTLKFSLDGGTTFTEVFGGDALAYPPDGDVKQIIVKRGGASDATFDLIINRGP